MTQKLTPGQMAAHKAWATRRKNEAAAKEAARSPAQKAWATRRRNEAARAEEAAAMTPAEKAWATRRRNVEEQTPFTGKRADLARAHKDASRRADADKKRREAEKGKK